VDKQNLRNVATAPQDEVLETVMSVVVESESLERPAPGGDPKPDYQIAPPGLPTQLGPHGIRFDFNEGGRVMVPEKGGPWHIQLFDDDVGCLIYEAHFPAAKNDDQERCHRVSTAKKMFVPFRIEVHRQGKLVFTHRYNPRSRKVLIRLPVKTLGDSLAWIGYAPKFQAKHGCELVCSVSDPLIPLLSRAYPHISFISNDRIVWKDFYASYNVRLFFEDPERFHQPIDFRQTGLHRTAAYILGVDEADPEPFLRNNDTTPPIAEPYVTISAQATTQCKYWNNPDGWRELVDSLKAAGYRVICIDQKPRHGANIVWNQIPYGSENQTGDRPLEERMRWIRHAAFHIGLSSGLSWLAWAVGTPTVLISGFTLPLNEFTTPYRVINYHVCNGCWNDVRQRFDHYDFLYCPHHKGTARQFECTRAITAEQVLTAIRRIPGYLGSTPEA